MDKLLFWIQTTKKTKCLCILQFVKDAMIVRRLSCSDCFQWTNLRLILLMWLLTNSSLARFLLRMRKKVPIFNKFKIPMISSTRDKRQLSRPKFPSIKLLRKKTFSWEHLVRRLVLWCQICMTMLILKQTSSMYKITTIKTWFNH